MAYSPGQKLPAAQLNASFDAKADQTALNSTATTAAAAKSVTDQIALGTAPDAGTLDGSELVTLSRGAGVLAKTLSDIQTWLASLFVREDDLANPTDPAKGAGMVGFLQAGANAVGRTLLSKTREMMVSPSDYGAVGDGVANDLTGIQRAIDALNASGGGTLVLPAGKTYRFGNNINLRNGVWIVGLGGKLVRGFDRTVNGVAISCAGNNLLWNVNYDGSSQTISVPGSDYIFYQDIFTDTATAPVMILGGNLDHSCGSFVCGASKNVKILNVNFGEYLDHCVYAGDRQNTTTSCADWLVEGCTVTAPTATREPFKARNGIDGYKILNNTVTAPNAFAFLDLSIGDATAPPKVVKNVLVDGNIATVQSAISMQNGGTGAVNTTAFDNVKFERGNSFACTSYSLRLGNFPSGSVQNGICAKKLVFRGRYDTTLASSAIINGDLTGLIDDLVIDADLRHNGELGLYYIGNVNKLTVKGYMYSANSGFVGKVIETPIPYAYSAFKPTITGLVEVSGLMTDGYIGYIIREVTFGNSATSGIVFDAIIENCKMLGPTAKQVVAISGGKLGDATGLMTVRDNDIRGGTITASTYKTGLLYEENFLQKVLISPAGNKFKVTVSDAGVVTTAAI